LRVINEDRVAGGGGFGAHPHRDMEIISVVLDGNLEHRDSMGNGSVIRPGEVQRMSAGTGVVHSEYNASKDDEVHFLQVWIEPSEMSVEPGYEQKMFSADEKKGRLRLLISPDGDDGSLRINQDARLYGSILAPGDAVAHEVTEGRHAWVQVAKGAVSVNGEKLAQGDAASVSQADALKIVADEDAEVLVFDLA
ncbi:MAG: pirin family protein, partial [Myxococcota bacterium]